MVNLEYRIGGLDSKYPTALNKLIVYREDERTLTLYALAKEMRESPVIHDGVADAAADRDVA